MKALTETLALFTPPFWLVAALAVLLGGAMLAAFVGTLQENVRRGEDMRRWQRVGVVRHAIGAVANATPGPQTQQSGTSIPTTFQR